nr:hypothetical protein [uncultured Fluviicola sp.]
MKFLLFCTLILSCFSLTAQVDSLSLEKCYLKKADSLFERGEYEASRAYFLSAQTYSLTKSSSERDLKEKAKFYLEKQRKVDVAITYNLTDSIKYKYRMEEANRWLTIYKDTSTAVSYFLEAHKIFPDKPEPMECIVSALDLQHRKMDTIVLSNKQAGKYLFIGKQPRYKFDYVSNKTTITGYQFRYLNYQLTGSQIDSVFCLKDSLPFTGVLISQGTIVADNSGTKTDRYISLYQFVSGMRVSQTDYQLCKAPSSKQIPNRLHRYIPFEPDEYVCGIQISFKNTVEKITYYPSGTLSGRSYYGTNSHKAIYYTESGDTLGTSLQYYSEDSIYQITSSKRFFESGRLKSFSYSKETIEGQKLINDYFERDEQGDTLKYIHFNALDGTTLSVQQWDDGGHLLRRLTNEAGSLISVPTSRTVFLSEDYQIISETEFVGNYNRKLLEGHDPHPLFETFDMVPDSQKSFHYVFYAYPKGIYGKESRKHYERIRKIQQKLEKN